MNWTSHDWTAIAATMSVARSRIRMLVRRLLRQAGHIRKSGFLELILIVAAAGSVSSQVLTPAEIKDPELRSLQQQYINDLKVMGQDIQTLPLKYHFYLSRKLDLDESEQQHADQRSIRFDRYEGQTVLAVTGNYYAAYSERIGPDQRARSTFLNLVMPILKSEVPRFQTNARVQGYAVEVSHHVMANVMGVTVERPENLMVYLPQSGALQLLGSKDENVQQAGLLQGRIFLNAQPINIWLNGEGPQPSTGADPNPSSTEGPMPRTEIGPAAAGEVGAGPGIVSFPNTPMVKPNDLIPIPARDTSPQALAALQASNLELIAKLIKELQPQAHFVSYASQSFVAFRKGIYLELSVDTSLP